MSEATNEALDRLIHERVMGKCWHEWQLMKISATRGGHVCVKCSVKRSRYGYDPNFKYSTHIEHAMLAVERMRGEGWYVVLTAANKGEWGARLSYFDMNSQWHELAVDDASLPRAICLCIAKALGLEVKL